MGYQPKQDADAEYTDTAGRFEDAGDHQCKCCGAYLSGSKCEYCGMVYEKKSHRKTINKKFLDPMILKS